MKKKPTSFAQVVPFETADGSKTLYDGERDIHYRSHHGAVSESRHVFLKGTGLLEVGGPWSVAELGFGAAVNFTQTVEAFRANENASTLVYHSVDWRVVPPGHLQFHGGEGGDLARRAAAMVHDGSGREKVVVRSEDGLIELHLHPSAWSEAELGEFSAGAFFHDPFAKNVNPEGWTAECFAWVRSVMEEEGRLATYSAATAVKRAMFEGGLWVASAPGPGRKREMTVASPSLESLQGVKGLTILDRLRYVEDP